MIQQVTLIGAGNLATQLGKALLKAGVKIIQVYSRTEKAARGLAVVLNTDYTNESEKINLSADLVLVAVKDDAIACILEKLECRQTKIAHTAGSVPLDLLARYSDHCGVFYPLQTFSKSRDVNFREIPVCVEANSAEMLHELKDLAMKISENVREINSREREVLHLSAVFVCNFVNHFYYLGANLLEKYKLPFSLLEPLILETAAKVTELNPYEAQTGPAMRYDETIINKHLNSLETQPELRKIYSFVSESIFLAHKKA